MKEARTIFLLMGLLIVLLFAAPKFQILMKKQDVPPPTPAQTPTPAPTPTITPTPTRRPLTFAEMNQRYGPCVYAPALMYHHVQTPEEAKAKNQVSLTVAPDTFRSQMEYLKNRGYTTIKPSDLIAYPYGFSSATGLEVLRSMNYTLAFTTIPGSTLCRGQRLTLPRIRIGNAGLSAYGL